jgi:hypothetical protein
LAQLVARCAASNGAALADPSEAVNASQADLFS